MSDEVQTENENAFLLLCSQAQVSTIQSHFNYLYSNSLVLAKESFCPHKNTFSEAALSSL